MMIVAVATDLMVTSSLEGIAARHDVTLIVMAPQRVESADLAESPRVVLIDLTAVTDIAHLVEVLREQFGRECQLVAFAPHVHVERIKTARQAGCDRVITRGQLQVVAEELISQQAG